MFEELSLPGVQATDLASCLYCGAALPSSTAEPIFDAHWGGTRSSHGLVCDGCGRVTSTLGHGAARPSIDFQAQYRSAVHTALKCCGLFAPRWIADSRIEAAKRFARNSQGSWQDFATRIEARSLPHGIVEKLGTEFNSVEIYWSSAQRLMAAVLTIAGKIKRAVVLGREVDARDAVLLVCEPSNGSGPLEAFYAELGAPAIARVDPKPPSPTELARDALAPRAAAASPRQSDALTQLRSIASACEAVARPAALLAGRAGIACSASKIARELQDCGLAGLPAKYAAQGLVEAQAREVEAATLAVVANVLSRLTEERRDQPARQPSEEEVRVAAYYRWLDRGQPNGDDWADWFDAEQTAYGRS